MKKPILNLLAVDVAASLVFGILTPIIANLPVVEIDLLSRSFLLPGFLHAAFFLLMFRRHLPLTAALILLPLGILVYVLSSTLAMLVAVPGSTAYLITSIIAGLMVVPAFTGPALLLASRTDFSALWWGILISAIAGVVFAIRPPGAISIVLSLYVFATFLSFRLAITKN